VHPAHYQINFPAISLQKRIQNRIVDAHSSKRPLIPPVAMFYPVLLLFPFEFDPYVTFALRIICIARRLCRIDGTRYVQIRHPFRGYSDRDRSSFITVSPPLTLSSAGERPFSSANRPSCRCPAQANFLRPGTRECLIMEREFRGKEQSAGHSGPCPAGNRKT